VAARHSCVVLFACAAANFALPTATTLADSLTWTGAGDGQSFHQATNWSPAQAPTSTDDCTIPAGTGTIRITSAASVRSLTTSRAVSVDSCSELAVGVELSLQGGITVSLNNACGLPGLAFGSGAATVSGSGTILISNPGVSGTVIVVRNASSLTIGSGITISYGPQSQGADPHIRVEAGCSLFNLGTIWARQATQSLSISGPGAFTNSGVLKATTGELQIKVASWSNTASIEIANAFLTVSGSWSNTGLISLTNSTWNVWGSYATLGPVQRTGGFVFVVNPTQSGVMHASAETGDLNLQSGPFVGITFQTSGGAKFVTSSTTLTRCTLAGRLEVSAGLTVKEGLTLQNGAIATGNSMIVSGGTQAIAGPGQVAFQSIQNSSILTIESDVVLRGVFGRVFTLTIADNSSVRNKGTMSGENTTGFNIAGAGVFMNEGLITSLASTTLTITVAHWTNAGPTEAGSLSIGNQVAWTNSSSISCIGGSTLSGTWTNTGTIQANDQWHVFKGSWTNSGLIKLINTASTFDGTYSSLGQFQRTGGSITLSGNFGGTQLEANLLTGDLTLTALTLNQCDIRSTDGAKLKATGPIQLSACVLRSDLTLLNCSVLTVSSNLTLAGGAVVTLNRGPTTCSAPAIQFGAGSAAIVGVGELLAKGDENLIRLNAAAKATIGSGIVIRIPSSFSKTAANIVLADSTAELTNQGTLSVDKPGVTLSISGGAFRNQGILDAVSGTLQVSSATGGLGTLRVASGAVARISGNPYAINVAPTLAPGARLELSGTYTIDAPIEATDATLSLSGTWTNNASVSALRSIVAFSGAMTNNQAITISGSSLSLTGTSTGNGSFIITDSTAAVNGFPLSVATFINTVINYSGAVPDGQMLQADSSTGDITLTAVTCNNSTLRARDGKRFLTAASHAITLNTCTLDGELAVTNCGTINVVGGLTFVNGILRLNNACPQGLVFSSVQTLSGTGAIIADGASSTTAQIIAASAALTVASGVSLQVGPAAAGSGISRVFFSSSSGSWTNQGSILHQAPGRELVFSGLGTFSSTGLVETTGGQITIASSGLSNFSGNRLTGGTWRAINAPIYFQGKEIRQIAANTELVLEGPLGDIPQLLPLDSSSGTLRIRNRTHAIKPASVFSNSGLLDLDSDATLAVTGRFVCAAAGTLRTEVSGLDPSQIGRITATTGATLNGKLHGSFHPSFTPLAGDETAPLITAPSFSGAFSSTCFDANPFGLGVQTFIDTGVTPRELSLIVTAASGTFPVLTQSPADASATPNAIFHASAAPANAALQWKKDTTPLADGPTGSGSTISGAATPTLTILNAQPSDVGAYTITLTNSCGTLTSSPAQLRLCPGDLNSDGMVDDSDFLVFLSSYNILDCADPAMPPLCPGDFNHDSVVDDADFLVFIPAYDTLLCP
jgi:hypothetical protein